MKNIKQTQAPLDAHKRKQNKPVIAYPIDGLPESNNDLYESARKQLTLIDETIIPPREAKTFVVPAGHFFRIVCIEGPQVGDLNIWNNDNINERFYSGKTRALYGTHVSTADRLYSNFPYLRPMATITHDTLDWYGWDEDGGGVHDVIGTRCDPYTHMALSGNEYHYCCHSNLCRALSKKQRKPISAYHLKDLLHGRGKPLNIATIYRILEFWCGLRIIHRLAALNKYVCCADPQETHTHVINCCQKCETTYESCNEEMGIDLERGPESLGFIFDSDNHLEIPVICLSCS